MFTEKVIITAFLDRTDTLKSNSKGGWSKFGPRRLFHYAIQLISKIQDAADDAKKGLWDETKFVEVFTESMDSRSTLEDTTYSILWRTCPSRFIRYDHLAPMIVGNLSGSNDLPTSNKRKRSPELRTIFDFVDHRAPGRRDTFFRWIHRKEGGGPQLNNLLIGRIVYGIESKFEGKNANSPAWQERFHDITLKTKINLGHFWADPHQFESAVRQFKKSKKTHHDLCRYKVNERNWAYRGDGGGGGPIILFSYTPEVEDTMDKLLSKQLWEKALVYAQMGYLTESFLNFLIQLKISHATLLKKNGTFAVAPHVFLAAFEMWET